MSEQTTLIKQKGDRGKKKALIISISDYDNLAQSKQLPFCKNDGEAVYETLLKQGYDISEEFKLVGRIEGARIKRAIINFFRKAIATDTLVFYFSGHGMPDGHGDCFLAPSDINREQPEAEGYPFYELEKQRERSVAKRVIIILDCCFSGAAGSEISMGDANDIANVARHEIQETFRDGEGKCLIASSLGDQLSYKMKDHDYSLFTYYLLDGLKGGGGRSVNSIGHVTASTLSNYLYNRVTENGRQKPITKFKMSGDIEIAYLPDFAFREMEAETHAIKLIESKIYANVSQVLQHSLSDPTPTEEAIQLASMMTSLSTVIMDVVEQVRMQRNEFFIVDLKGGKAWVTPNLYFLALLLSKRTSVKQIVFVETGQRDNEFVGSCSPDELLQGLGQAFPIYPKVADGLVFKGLDLALPLESSNFFAVLRAELERTGEQPNNQRIWLTSEELYRLIGDYLHRDIIEYKKGSTEIASKDYRTILNSPNPYVPVISERQLLTVINRNTMAVDIAKAIRLG